MKQRIKISISEANAAWLKGQAEEKGTLSEVTDRILTESRRGKPLLDELSALVWNLRHQLADTSNTN
jgi:hypothetical protein